MFIPARVKEGVRCKAGLGSETEKMRTPLTVSVLLQQEMNIANFYV
jgi:hypothetical protein